MHAASSHLSGQREGEGEDAALAFPALEPDATALALDQLLGEVERFLVDGHALGQTADLVPGILGRGGYEGIQSDRFGRLIIVEGIDGSGKSTQLSLLQQWLRREGYMVFFSEWNSSPIVKSTTRRGKKKAAVAVGHSILVIAWYLLTDNCDYQDLGGDYFVRRDTDRQRQRAVAQLQALGYQVTLEPLAA